MTKKFSITAPSLALREGLQLKLEWMETADLSPLLQGGSIPKILYRPTTLVQDFALQRFVTT